MKEKLKKAREAIVSFVKAIPGFIKKTPTMLRNLVVPRNVTWPTMPNTFRRTGAVLAVSTVSAVIIGVMDAVYGLLLHIPFMFG